MRDMVPAKKKHANRWRLVSIEAAFLFVLWLLLSGHYDLFHLLLGVFSVLLVIVINRDGNPIEGVENVPIKIRRLLAYLPWLAKEMIKSSLHVARVVLSPRMPIDPMMVRFKSNQPNDFARVILANSITLTPGTLTVELSADQFLVHALTKNTAEGLVESTMQTKVARLFTDKPEKVVFDVEYNPSIRKF